MYSSVSLSLFILPCLDRRLSFFGLSIYTSSYVFVATFRNTSVERTSFSSALHQWHQSLPLNTTTTCRLFLLARLSAAPRLSVKPSGVDVAAPGRSDESSPAFATVIFVPSPWISPSATTLALKGLPLKSSVAFLDAVLTIFEPM